MDKLKSCITKINEIDILAKKRAEKHLDSRMKPVGSLGFLEELGIKISGITGNEFYQIKNSCHIVAASDNGVVEEGVSSCPTEYTAIVSEAMLQEIAAIGILSKNLKVDLKVVDVGINGDIKKNYPNLYKRKISYGTKNFTKEFAMTRKQAIEAIEIGIDLIEEFSNSYDIFSNGEMGIGNTTTSSAILYSLTRDNLDEVVGRGGGLSDLAFIEKKRVIKESCEKYNTFNMDPIDVVAAVGGYDIACMIGMYLGAAAKKKPMLTDGFISSVAAIVATKIEPKVKNYIIMTHKSEEPGMDIILKELKLKAPLNMNMRLGEGTGAIFVHSMAKCAMEIIRTMKTKEEVYNIIL
ncbi:MAG: nicotinate-nucleotide--dimethylbenzimidazole phosphoribosyltransferase [Fusobacteriaceae bacterium]